MGAQSSSSVLASATDARLCAPPPAALRRPTDSPGRDDKGQGTKADPLIPAHDSSKPSQQRMSFDESRAVLRGSACRSWSYWVRNLSRPGHAARPSSLRVASCGDSPLPENIPGVTEKDRKACRSAFRLPRLLAGHWQPRSLAASGSHSHLPTSGRLRRTASHRSEDAQPIRHPRACACARVRRARPARGCCSYGGS